MSKSLDYFKQITQIPRPSKKEEKIRNFLINWAGSRGFESVVDKVGNLIIYVPGNNKSEESVILQAHMDMVCVKTPDSFHSFESDPLDIYEEDGFLKARNTTLGADNGVGIAIAMSSVDFPSHPPLELVFTVDEEAGMSGALELDYSLLKSKKVINLDNENEQEICISSAGGIGLNFGKDLEFKNIDNPIYMFEISGMKGGHSGVDIDKNHGNAIEVFLGFLNFTDTISGIGDIFSGIASNVIPNKLDCQISLTNEAKFKSDFGAYLAHIKTKFDCPDISFNLEKISSSGVVIKNGMDLFKKIGEIKLGVYKMSEKIAGLVETSINLGIIGIEDKKLILSYLARSSINTELHNLVKQVERHFLFIGFCLNLDRGYPGWQDDPDGILVKLASEQILKITGKPAQVIAIHAGLECGAIVSGLGEDTNAISICSTMHNVHSVNERVEIASIEKMERIIEGILEGL
ncbi:beta-Ala-His dipeptidase [Candidatus Gracilibacteria bacterium]|nr:beta-Ala-His dipeptidase [Candidatus Gracilibacteria bacterium]